MQQRGQGGGGGEEEGECAIADEGAEAEGKGEVDYVAFFAGDWCGSDGRGWCAKEVKELGGEDTHCFFELFL